MLSIGRLASRWNVPIIAHLSGDDALSDRTGLFDFTIFELQRSGTYNYCCFPVFDTLGSVALTSATEMARATRTLLDLYGWKQVGSVTLYSAQMYTIGTIILNLTPQRLAS